MTRQEDDSSLGLSSDDRWMSRCHIISTCDQNVFIRPATMTGGRESTTSNKFSALMWSKDLCRFIQCSDEDASRAEQSSVSSQCNAECLYGILRLGNVHLLIYVTKVSDPVAVTPFRTEVRKILRMEFLSLPEAPLMKVSPTLTSASGGSTTPVRQQPYIGKSVPKSVLAEYKTVVEEFCQCSSHSRGSHLLVSFQRNMAERFGAKGSSRGNSERNTPHNKHNPRNPMNRSATSTPMDHATSSSPSFYEEVTASSVFQWNYQVSHNFFPSCSSSDCGVHVPPVIRGMCSSIQFPFDGQPLLCALIARAACKHAGTRYNSRGCNSAGYAANFVETEQLMWGRSSGTSYTIIRGSVPVQWRQPADLTLKPKVSVVGDHSSDRQEAFDQHLGVFGQLYGYCDLHCFNLLSRHPKEQILTTAYEEVTSNLKKEQLSYLNIRTLRYTHYNLGRVLSKRGKFEKEIMAHVAANEKYPHVTVFDAEASSPEEVRITSRQPHYIRVNCLDCLDRTNVTQFVVALRAACRQALLATDSDQAEPSENVQEEIRSRLLPLWSEHGNVVSLLYAGTEALLSDVLFTSKRTLLGKLYDGQTACKRFIQQNFRDGRKQDRVSLITSAHEPSAKNPFEWRMTGLNIGVALALVISAVLLCMNTLVMVLFQKKEMRFVLMQCAWIFLCGAILALVRRDATNFTNRPLLH